MLKNGVYVLTKDSKVDNNLDFKQNSEFEIVNGVVYMGGFPLPFNLQGIIINWMEKNIKLFVDDTRR